MLQNSISNLCFKIKSLRDILINGSFYLTKQTGGINISSCVNILSPTFARVQTNFNWYKVLVKCWVISVQNLRFQKFALKTAKLTRYHQKCTFYLNETNGEEVKTWSCVSILSTTFANINQFQLFDVSMTNWGL